MAIHEFECRIVDEKIDAGEDAEDPTYIFTELRVGYLIPKGETWGRDRRPCLTGVQ